MAPSGLKEKGYDVVIVNNNPETVSTQVDWFGPFPSSDMFGQMGLAQSTHLKYMLYNGWAIVVANIILFALLFQILV